MNTEKSVSVFDSISSQFIGMNVSGFSFWSGNENSVGA